MTTIKATVSGAEITLEISGQLTSGMVGVPVSFSFDSAWDSLIKTAVFRAGKVSKDQMDVGTETTVPWEVMNQENYKLQIGVYGCNADGTVVIPTVWADADMIYPGADPSGDPSTDPTLPVWQQLLEKLHSGELQGPQGPQGEQGPKGEKGDTGDPGPEEVFIAKYGVTTFAELEEAYNAGKITFCQVNNYRVAMHAYIPGRNMTFFRVTSDDRTNYYCTSTGWGTAIAKHTPGVHATQHGAGGSDPITPESIGAASAKIVGDIETALDSILAIQNELIGGDGV